MSGECRNEHFGGIYGHDHSSKKQTYEAMSREENVDPQAGNGIGCAAVYGEEHPVRKK